jgi:hypothetical protein
MSAASQKDVTIAVGDLSIPVTVRELPIKDLRYYKSNPRIFRILKECGTRVSQDVIERELWKLDSTKDLFRDIRNNGGLVEEVLVRDSEVLEGNLRLCAYRRLLRKAKEEDDRDGIARWSRIRAKILPSDVSDEAVFAVLGILHIRSRHDLYLTSQHPIHLRRIPRLPTTRRMPQLVKPVGNPLKSPTLLLIPGQQMHDVRVGFVGITGMGLFHARRSSGVCVVIVAPESPLVCSAELGNQRVHRVPLR